MEDKERAHTDQQEAQGQDGGFTPQDERSERERLKASRVPISKYTLFARRFRYQTIGMMVVVLALAATLWLIPGSIAIQIDLATLTPRAYVPTVYYALFMLAVGVFVYLRSFTADKSAYIKYSSSLPLLLLLHLVICAWNLL